MVDDNALLFCAVLNDGTMKRIVDIAGDQANRLNDGDAKNPMYADIDFLLGLTNRDGRTLLLYVGEWYDGQDEAKR